MEFIKRVKEKIYDFFKTLFMSFPSGKVLLVDLVYTSALIALTLLDVHLSDLYREANNLSSIGSYDPSCEYYVPKLICKLLFAVILAVFLIRRIKYKTVIFEKINDVDLKSSNSKNYLESTLDQIKLYVSSGIKKSKELGSKGGRTLSNTTKVSSTTGVVVGTIVNTKKTPIGAVVAFIITILPLCFFAAIVYVLFSFFGYFASDILSLFTYFNIKGLHFDFIPAYAFLISHLATNAYIRCKSGMLNHKFWTSPLGMFYVFIVICAVGVPLASLESQVNEISSILGTAYDIGISFILMFVVETANNFKYHKWAKNFY